MLEKLDLPLLIRAEALALVAVANLDQSMEACLNESSDMIIKMAGVVALEEALRSAVGWDSPRWVNLLQGTIINHSL